MYRAVLPNAFPPNRHLGSPSSVRQRWPAALGVGTGATTFASAVQMQVSLALSELLETMTNRRGFA
jgi:hypothetical protein